MPTIPQEIAESTQKLIDNSNIVEQFAQGPVTEFIPVAGGTLRPLLYWQKQWETMMETEGVPIIQQLIEDEAPDLAEVKRRMNVAEMQRKATLDLDFAAGDYALDDGEKTRTTSAGEVLTVERATPKWVFGPNGKLREVPPDTLARQWNPETGEPEGVLIEESRTNLLLWSEDFTQWAQVGATVTQGAGRAPDGTMTACRLEKDAQSFRAVYEQITASLSDHTGSVFLKAGTLTHASVAVFDNNTSNSLLRGVVDLITGTVQQQIGTLTATPCPNGWWRVSGEASVTQQDVRFYIYPGDRTETAAGDIYAWGAQLEEGGEPSSYIPTTDAAVTRSADNVSRVLGEELNVDAFTLYIDFDFISTTGNQTFGSMMTVTSAPQHANSLSAIAAIYYRADVGQIRGEVRPGDNLSPTVIQVNSDPDAAAALSIDRSSQQMIFAVSGVAYSATWEGMEEQWDDISQLILMSGLRGIGDQGQTTGVIKESYIYPRALTAAELEELTK